jgi:NADH-quinone oxidoreductase subunit J
MRTLVVVTVVAMTAVAGLGALGPLAGIAAAQTPPPPTAVPPGGPPPAAAPRPAVAEAEDGFVVAPCSPDIEAAVRATVPATTKIICRAHKTEARREGNRMIAGRVEAVRADAVLPDGRIASLEISPPPEPKVLHVSYSHSDVTVSSGKGMAVLFWAFALASVVGSLFVITRRNLIAAVMGMVGSFLGVAAIYMMLFASFLAVVQVLVYAGAIMVLFVFVVMILNRPEDEPVAPAGRAGQALGGLAILYLVIRLMLTLVRVQPPDAEVARAAPPPLPPHCVTWKDNACTEVARHEWGSVGAVGSDLFNAGIFPFEAISVLLLVAVVGAIAIARPLHAEDDDPAKKRAEGGVA